MASVNKVILIGNLGKDPEVRHLEGGVTVARASIATSEKFKDKSGETKEKTEWHNLVFWRGVAEVVEKYVTKGSSIYVEGKLQTTSYEKDGQTRYSTEIVVQQLTMLGGNGKPSGPAATSGGDEPDDLPF